MSKFLDLCTNIFEDINSTRKPIQKVNAMSPKEFIAFLKEFLPYAQNGTIDLKDIRITEKIDGSSISMTFMNNDLFFESSHSGITTWDKVPFKDAAEFLYLNFKSKFQMIWKKYGDFKIKGELIYIHELEENGKVTPICASYLANRFGEKGGIVIFELYKLENNELIYFDDLIEQEIFEQIKSFNNEQFKFYINSDIVINKNVRFTLDANRLLALINKPEFNKHRFSKKTDAAVLQELAEIQENIVNQLSEIVDNTTGAFSNEGDLIEGIVLKINNSGNQYGIFSNGYKDLKDKYWSQSYIIEAASAEFLQNLFGFSKISAIKRHWQEFNLEEIKDKWQSELNIAINKAKNAYIEIINSKTIPGNSKHTQLNMAEQRLHTLESEKFSSFENFSNFVASLGEK